MARILVVDDRPSSRECVVTLLRSRGHEVVEAGDGEDALRLARESPPDLILSDIVMPRMDGVEFVRSLREDPVLARVPVVFVTATFRWRGAQELARSAGVRWVLAKPVEPGTMLSTVDEALGGARGGAATLVAPPPADASARLAALVELGVEMGGEVDPTRLLDQICDAARGILGAEFAVLGILEGGDGAALRHFTASRASRRFEDMPRPPARAGVLGRILGERRPVRLSGFGGDPVRAGLPADHPPIESFLGVPLETRVSTLGWLYLANSPKVGGFSEDDERILATVGIQAAVAYENARLRGEALARNAALEKEVEERRAAEAKILERNRILELAAEVGVAVVGTTGSLREMLQACCGAVVIRLDAAFARIWTLDAKGEVLELQASAGMYTRIDGAHARVPVGRFKIGLIAAERRPHLTNDLPNDPRVGDPEWARREGMTAFAGYPLLVGEELLGVLAMFSRRPLGEGALLGLRTVADTIALGIRGRASVVDLRRSEERFRQLAESIHQSFWLMDARTGVILYASPATAEIWGRPAADLSTREARLATLHPEDRERVEAATALGRHPDSLDLSYRILRPDGTVRWIRDRAFPVRDPSGEVVRIARIAEDITELRRTEEQLHQAMKMEAVGRLAGGVAHDFNNLLTVIMGYAELAMMRKRDDPVLSSQLAEVKRAGERACSLVHQLLAFSRKSPVAPRSVDLNAVVAGMGSMLPRLLGEDVELVTVLAPGLWPVRADPSQMEQVVMNLAVNARDAMPGGGRLTLETSNAEVGAGGPGSTRDLAPGPCAVLAMSDTGTGMDEATQARIFEPFFTTKGEGKGTGLGLSTVYGIVKQAGGGITVYSEPGRGSTFRIFLPRIASAAGAAGPAPGRPAVLGGAETILVVEDNSQLRQFTMQVLRDLGYRVLEAADPAAALAVSAAEAGAVDLMVTDVVMPGMTGGALAEAIAPGRPRMRVLFVSGYTAGVLGHHHIPESGPYFLPKPFSPEDLARRVREMLDGPGGGGGTSG